MWKGRLRESDFGRAAGIAAGLVAAIWAVKHYLSLTDTYLDSGGAPQDLAVFLRAAGSAIHGVSPYTFHADQTYAYPPVLAFFVAPLHPLGDGVAMLVWTLLSLAAIALALWLIGVRDWRCYAITAAYPATRSAVDLGTIGPMLLLAVAAAWRLRDHALRCAAAVGVAVALKLFLWPLAIWLAVTRRIRAAAAAAGFAVALVLVSWAAIGFAGVTEYPRLLRRLADEEATSSYSSVAYGVRAHLPENVARLLAVLFVVALLVVAALVARSRRQVGQERDASVFTITLAAALAASPIVWGHYFLLLLVPLALTRPRLSLLWLVPFAYYPLGETAWPTGDARKLGLALVTTTILIVAPLLRGTRWEALLASRARSPLAKLSRSRPWIRRAPLEEAPEPRARPR